MYELIHCEKNKKLQNHCFYKKKTFYKKMINAWAKESLSLQTQELRLLLKKII